MYDVIVIGGGPAGMMAAIFAARSGAKVAIVEKNDRLGLKVLATGNGRCNISNSEVTSSRYYGSVVSIFDVVYKQFDNVQTRAFFRDLEVELKEEDRGRLFPVTDKASTVVNALTKAIENAGVEVLTRSTVVEVVHGTEWRVKLGEKELKARQIVIATGGKAAHRLGSSGDGLFWAKKLGHTVTPIYAALVPIETEEAYVSDVMGVKLNVLASAFVEGKVLRKQAGDMLFTHYGLSGPSVMALAGTLAPFVGNKKTEIQANMLPGLTRPALELKLLEIFQANPKKKVSNLLDSLLPAKLAKLVVRLAHLESKNASEVSKAERNNLIEQMQSFTLTVKKIRPLRDAQVTSGGIPVSEVTADLESKLVKGLYFVGEVLDIDGDSGGFNLQWAWSSGAVVGQVVARSQK